MPHSCDCLGVAFQNLSIIHRILLLTTPTTLARELYSRESRKSESRADEASTFRPILRVFGHKRDSGNQLKSNCFHLFDAVFVDPGTFI